MPTTSPSFISRKGACRACEVKRGNIERGGTGETQEKGDTNSQSTMLRKDSISIGGATLELPRSMTPLPKTAGSRETFKVSLSQVQWKYSKTFS